jgi:hypothetical protein
MPALSFRLFAQACLGVLVGAFLALAIVRLALPLDGPAPNGPAQLLPWINHLVVVKPREKGFYLLALILGGACGYAATYRVLPGRVTGRYLWLLVVLSVPVGEWIIGRTLAGASFLPAAAVSALGAAFLWLVYARGTRLVASTGVAASEPAWPHWPYPVLLGLLTLVLVPSSFAAVALKIGPNPHAVIFLIGPALYALGNGLLPGTDYFSLYSVGLPWLFHFVMGQSGGQAVLSYVIIVIAASWLFYAHLIHLLHWLYRSWLAAAVAAFIPLFLGFVYPGFGAPFFAPSSSILRYPLLTVCASLTGLWAEYPGRTLRLLPVAAACGLALFLETESGIVMLLGAILTTAVIHPWQARIIAPVVAFLIVALAVWMALLVAAFGFGVLQLEFFRRLFDGIILYGDLGLSGARANWSLYDWNWLYNVVAPGAMLATVAVIARPGALTPDTRRAAVLAFFAISGLMLLAKYANQSLAAVWQVSSVGPFAVLGWWCVALVRRLGSRRELPSSARPLWRARLAHPLQSVAAAAIVGVALAFVISPSESGRNPARYGLLAWADFPSLLKWPFLRPAGCVDMDCFPLQPTASDVDLITARLRAHGQVAIVSSRYDWIYLAAAHRPPLLTFLPSSEIFAQDQLLQSLQRIEHADYVYAAKADGRPYIVRPDLWTAVTDLLETSFQKDGESDHLVVWKRVPTKETNAVR